MWRGVPELVKRSLLTLQVVAAEELEALHRLLHVPEEVALRLADAEYRLFYQVPPIDYLRQVTLDLGTEQQTGAASHHPHATDSAIRPSVRSLIKRFNEVSDDSQVTVTF